ncbi:MAG: phosphate ABC transporter permease PstA, partial [Thermoguttaceae bacterium]|nr:phosphate ABC transporter permease PstA [Thermoguttaceae bacterium]
PSAGSGYTTLREALEATRRWRPAPAEAETSLRWLDIVCEPADGPPARPRRPRHAFHVNLRTGGGGGEGDGTETMPWWGLDAAVDELVDLERIGELELRPGERIRLWHHEMFTAGPLERRKKAKETVAKTVFMLMAMTLVAPVFAILGYLLVMAWPALSLAFLWENPKDYMTAGGIWAPLVGTFFLVLGSLMVAAPVGVLAGVYLNEYARDNWLTRLINLAVVNLAGVPSIVHALFGVGAFVLFFRMGRSLLAASCTVAVMTLPVIITSTREALASVPMAFREACWNLGATRWQTIRTIVLPNSISGILTGVILQVSRAAGETAPILFTGAVFFVPVADHGLASFVPYGLDDRFMALSMHLFTLATQVRGVSDPIQYGTAVVLIGLVLVVNSLSIGLRMYLRSRKKW